MICSSLDTCCVAERGWEAFGHEIGIKKKQVLDWIKELQSRMKAHLGSERKLNNSPSALILDYFMKDKPDRMMEKLQKLREIFVKIGNHEAKRYVEQEIEERMGKKRRKSRDSGYDSRPGSEILPSQSVPPIQVYEFESTEF